MSEESNSTKKVQNTSANATTRPQNVGSEITPGSIGRGSPNGLNRSANPRAGFATPSPSTTRRADNGLGAGINAVHVSAAREMVQLHTRGRGPPALQSQSQPRNLPSNKQGPPLFSESSRSSTDNNKGGSPPLFSESSRSITDNKAGGSPPIGKSAVANPTNFSSSFPTNISIPAKSHEGSCSNPQCAHCGQVIIPSPKSSFPIQDQPSITINDWSIFTIKKPILNSPELDYLNDNRFDFPLPEMIFGNNHVKLINEKTKSVIEFNALDALDSLESESNLKVSYHKEWLSSRRSSSSPSTLDKSEKAQKENSNKDLKKLTDLESVKPYDWTYSTNYKGTLENITFYPTDEKIPIDKLLRPDPILFFDESILFEDELGDNGISMLSTKIRVMPLCLLLLCRLFLRIDNVIFRIRDTRVYIDLESNLVLREYKEQECSYDDLLRKVGAKNSNDPKSLLRDINWVSQNIPVLKVETESNVPPTSNRLTSV